MKGAWYVYEGPERTIGGFARLPVNATVIDNGLNEHLPAGAPDPGLVSVRRPNWPDGLGILVPADQLRPMAERP